MIRHLRIVVVARKVVEIGVICPLPAGVAVNEMSNTMTEITSTSISFIFLSLIYVAIYTDFDAQMVHEEGPSSLARGVGPLCLPRDPDEHRPACFVRPGPSFLPLSIPQFFRGF
jgi:hypothetical protein